MTVPLKCFFFPSCCAHTGRTLLSESDRKRKNLIFTKIDGGDCSTSRTVSFLVRRLVLDIAAETLSKRITARLLDEEARTGGANAFSLNSVKQTTSSALRFRRVNKKLALNY